MIDTSAMTDNDKRPMIAEGTEQRSLAWFRARLGCFSGSRVAELMKEGRKKGEPWSETAKAYICQVAAERMMNPTFVADDDIFVDYLEWTSASSKAMRWGEEPIHEAEPRRGGGRGVELQARHDRRLRGKPRRHSV